MPAFYFDSYSINLSVFGNKLSMFLCDTAALNCIECVLKLMSIVTIKGPKID